MNSNRLVHSLGGRANQVHDANHGRAAGRRKHGAFPERPIVVSGKTGGSKRPTLMLTWVRYKSSSPAGTHVDGRCVVLGLAVGSRKAEPCQDSHTAILSRTRVCCFCWIDQISATFDSDR